MHAARRRSSMEQAGASPKCLVLPRAGDGVEVIDVLQVGWELERVGPAQIETTEPHVSDQH